jgi:hypothetical protein
MHSNPRDQKVLMIFVSMAERKRQILISNLPNPRPELDGVYIEKAATDDGLTHRLIERCNPGRRSYLIANSSSLVLSSVCPPACVNLRFGWS